MRVSVNVNSNINFNIFSKEMETESITTAAAAAADKPNIGTPTENLVSNTHFNYILNVFKNLKFDCNYKIKFFHIGDK